eukprot:jgi/Botrbrau1/5354/Bobra.0346s0025.1
MNIPIVRLLVRARNTENSYPKGEGKTPENPLTEVRHLTPPVSTTVTSVIRARPDLFMYNKLPSPYSEHVHVVALMGIERSPTPGDAPGFEFR